MLSSSCSIEIVYGMYEGMFGMGYYFYFYIFLF